MKCTTQKPPLFLLCGGKSSRMGKPKGLLTFQGKPWFWKILEDYSDFGSQVWLGFGHHAEKYLKALPILESGRFFLGTEIQWVINKAPKYGPFSTLQTILLQALKSPWQKALVHLVDIPLVGVSTLEEMCRPEADVVTLRFGSQGGHPVLLSRQFCAQLLHQDPGLETSRLDFQIHNATSKIEIQTQDERAAMNLNRPEAWQCFLKLCEDESKQNDYPRKVGIS